jgi:hypothetical protein
VQRSSAIAETGQIHVGKGRNVAVSRRGWMWEIFNLTVCSHTRGLLCLARRVYAANIQQNMTVFFFDMSKQFWARN